MLLGLDEEPTKATIPETYNIHVSAASMQNSGLSKKVTMCNFGKDCDFHFKVFPHF